MMRGEEGSEFQAFHWVFSPVILVLASDLLKLLIPNYGLGPAMAIGEKRPSSMVVAALPWHTVARNSPAKFPLAAMDSHEPRSRPHRRPIPNCAGPNGLD